MSKIAYFFGLEKFALLFIGFILFLSYTPTTESRVNVFLNAVEQIGETATIDDGAQIEFAEKVYGTLSQKDRNRVAVVDAFTFLALSRIEYEIAIRTALFVDERGGECDIIIPRGVQG
jgi:hypothetical protein